MKSRSELRSSGIDIIGDIPWGTHISYLYSPDENLSEVICPYIRDGLVNNELCLFIYSNKYSFDTVKNWLSQYVKGIDNYIDSGQLILLPHTEWYLKNGGFDESRTKQQWVQFVKYSLKKGYDGLRAVADASEVDKKYFRTFSDYEYNVNKVISKLPFTVICLYDVNKLDIFEISQVIKNHRYIITRHENKLEVIRNIELLVKEKQIDELEYSLEKNRKLLNETLEYDKVKTEFFANVAHEFRTPLNVILSAVQLLKLHINKKEENEKENKYLNSIRQNCFRLIRLVNNLIDISKIDSDYFEIKLKNCDIVSIVQKIAMSVVEYAMHKDITIYYNSDIEEKVMACDSEQIERILLNLLSNSIKFTNKGGKIWVNIHDRGNSVQITVKDNGIGIPEDKQLYIFDRFQQVDKSLSRQQEGSGIGLSLVKALVEKHNGTISMKSKPGKGSEFLIDIPCQTVPQIKNRPDAERVALRNNQVEWLNVELSDIYL
jgi:signal transduction histidine kinase